MVKMSLTSLSSCSVIPESSRTLNDVRDLITLIVFTNKNCKYVFAVIYDGVWEDILGKA